MKKMIGVVGGVGPYAGTDLVNKIFDNTRAKCDQDHIPVALISIPEDIPQRTDFLIGATKTNPAHAAFEIIKKLEMIGSSVIGISCNTFHSPRIFDVLNQKLKEAKSHVKLIHMIEEVADYIQQELPTIKNVGLLCVMGVYKSNVYSNILESRGIQVITPSDKIKEDFVHDSIFNADYGIKAQSNPVTDIAKNKLIAAITHLQEQGAEAIILGCTEIPLALEKPTELDLIFIDPATILARALIRETYPQKLKLF